MDKNRIENTEKQVNEFFEKSKKIMLEKNKQRGDCWRGSGLMGQFIEIHSMYSRLRVLIYESEIPEKGSILYDEWRAQVENALEDLRNFTILGEMCLAENNIRGENYFNDIL